MSAATTDTWLYDTANLRDGRLLLVLLNVTRGSRLHCVVRRGGMYGMRRDELIHEGISAWGWPAALKFDGEWGRKEETIAVFARFGICAHLGMTRSEAGQIERAVRGAAASEESAV